VFLGLHQCPSEEEEGLCFGEEKGEMIVTSLIGSLERAARSPTIARAKRGQSTPAERKIASSCRLRRRERSSASSKERRRTHKSPSTQQKGALSIPPRGRKIYRDPKTSSSKRTCLGRHARGRSSNWQAQGEKGRSISSKTPALL